MVPKKCQTNLLTISENFPAAPNYIPVGEFQVIPNGTERAVACPPCLNDAANSHRFLVRSSHEIPIEKVAAASLAYKGYEPYLPCYRRRRRWSDRMTKS